MNHQVTITSRRATLRPTFTRYPVKHRKSIAGHAEWPIRFEWERSGEDKR